MSAEARKSIAQRALGLVDLTDLNDDSDEAAIDSLCARAQTEHGPVAAICIWPRLITHAKKQLVGTNIPIATVVNFPGGEEPVEKVQADTIQAIEDGADEIDLVIPYRAMLAGDLDAVKVMVSAIRAVSSGKALLKTILETGELKDAVLIRQASELAIAGGADFIKTSTGKVAVNATLEAAEVMLQAIADSGMAVGFKPAGGIKTTEDCGAYLELADRIMGREWASSNTLRFGASSVLGDLLAALDGRDEAAAAASASEGY